MNALLSYIVKSVIAGGLLYLYYAAVLRNKKFHSYNRFYLLLSMSLSLIIPLFSFRWLYITGSEPAVVTNFATILNTPQDDGNAFLFQAGKTLLTAGAFISLALLILLAARITWIYRIKVKGRCTPMPGFTFIETDAKQAPFSFLRNLFWKQGLSMTDTSGERIFKHELTHIRQKHSYDRLFTQTVCSLLWVNPFFWLIQKELSTVHEFIADAAAVDAGDTESFAKMLLYPHHQGLYLAPAHSFFNSSIKRRIIMISSSTQPRYSYMRRLLALPVILLVLALLTLSIKAQQAGALSEAQVKTIPQAGADTMPKSTAPAAPNTSPGKPALRPLNPANGLTPLPAAAGQKPDPLTAASAPSQPAANQAPIIVQGYKIDPVAATEPAATTPQPAQMATTQPVVVAGYKLDNITAAGPGSAAQPAAVKTTKPTVVAGYKIDNVTAAEPASAPQPAAAATSQPVVVAGYKLETVPGQEPAAAVQRPVTTTSAAPKVVTGYKLEVSPAEAPKPSGRKAKAANR